MSRARDDPDTNRVCFFNHCASLREYGEYVRFGIRETRRMSNHSIALSIFSVGEVKKRVSIMSVVDPVSLHHSSRMRLERSGLKASESLP